MLVHTFPEELFLPEMQCNAFSLIIGEKSSTQQQQTPSFKQQMCQPCSNKLLSYIKSTVPAVELVAVVAKDDT